MNALILTATLPMIEVGGHCNDAPAVLSATVRRALLRKTLPYAAPSNLDLLAVAPAVLSLVNRLPIIGVPHPLSYNSSG